MNVSLCVCCECECACSYEYVSGTYEFDVCIYRCVLIFMCGCLPASYSPESAMQVLPGDEIVAIDGMEMRGKHAREVKSHIASNHSSTIGLRLNRGGRILDIRMPRSTTSTSSPSSRDASASPSRSRGMSGGTSDLAGIDQQVQRILRTSSDDETRQLEENLAQSRRRHAARLQEELARNRSDSSDRLQLEIKVLRAEHAGSLEQKLAEIRQQHYQKIEEELEALRSQCAARLDQVSLSLSLSFSLSFPVSPKRMFPSRPSPPCVRSFSHTRQLPPRLPNMMCESSYDEEICARSWA